MLMTHQRSVISIVERVAEAEFERQRLKIDRLKFNIAALDKEAQAHFEKLLPYVDADELRRERLSLSQKKLWRDPAHRANILASRRRIAGRQRNSRRGD